MHKTPATNYRASLISSALVIAAIPSAIAQINSGSDGSDGAFNPSVDTVIDMADHPDGIYHYTSVIIPSGVTVSFNRNAGNTPVVWLVQTDCVIEGTVSLNGTDAGEGGLGGPGGYHGGAQGGGGADPGDGLGPGGGKGGEAMGGNASHATMGTGTGTTGTNAQAPAGEIYGNQYAVPLIGGSGGGGNTAERGAGGGGAILIAASGEIRLEGTLSARGGNNTVLRGGGGGSGGTIRLAATTLTGGGALDASPGRNQYFSSYRYYDRPAGAGRIRQDAMVNQFTGTVSGEVTRGLQPIIIPPPAQNVSLSIQTVAGVQVATAPGGQLISPDVIIPTAQQNPVPIVVACSNIPLGTEIIVDVKPANGQTVRAVGFNNTGTQSTSTTTVQVEMPRGGGTIQAKAVSGIQLAANDDPDSERKRLAQTGWTADGERFSAVEITAGLSSQRLAYLTDSGKRYELQSR